MIAAVLLAGCSRDEEPSAAAPAPSAPPWSDATDAPVTAEPPPTVQPGAQAAGAGAASATTLVPERFRGEWSMEVADCGTGMSDSRLVIGSDDIAFYESSGAITKVEQAGPDEVVLTAELSGEGEGPWTSTSRFRISADGATLTTMGEGDPFVRRRCPTAAPARP